MVGEVVLDLAMAGYRLGRSCSRILIPIMSTAMTNKNAAELLDLADQLSSLHAT